MTTSARALWALLESDPPFLSLTWELRRQAMSAIRDGPASSLGVTADEHEELAAAVDSVESP